MRWSTKARAALAALTVAAGAVVVAAPAAPAQTAWTLTAAQRQAYLHHYAPVILKRGDENNGKQGRDWITNFDFDQDGVFATNRASWKTVPQYVAGAAGYDRWRVRPTLYTALIEYTEAGAKNLVLLYHVYNAADKDAEEIHDWERVEIIVRGVTGTPGAPGEAYSSSTLTHHKDHIIRRSYDPDVRFMPTATGRHLLVWQADESDFDLPSAGPHGHELRYVTNSYPWIAERMNSATSAEVNISGASDKRNVHYAFVPEGSAAAAQAWRAGPLTATTAAGLASRVDNGTKVPWSGVKRITYELQDLADIIPTHWQGGPWAAHWLSGEQVDILLETPILAESGQAEVPPGRQRFYTRSRDNSASDLTDGREGVPSKKWLYGAYSAELNEDTPSGTEDFGGFAGLGTDSYGMTRGAASGDLASHGQYWRQHDFFVHSGALDGAERREAGRWLPAGWHLGANGGFDGRWAQLFDDRAGQEPVAPLTLALTPPGNRCTDVFRILAHATGGTLPYTFTWSNAQTASAPQANPNYAYTYGGLTTVVVRSADGQSLSRQITVTTYCKPGEHIP